MTRAERAAEAVRLRKQGLIYREIAERMGISLQYAHQLVSDPDGAKLAALRESYRRPCADCGALMNGHDGLRGKRAPTRCRECSTRRQKATAVWTKEGIVEAIQRFHECYSRPPAAADFNAARAEVIGHHWRAERYREGNFPSTTQVQLVFGSWNAAIRAAGFQPLVRGHYPRSERGLGAHLDDERRRAA